MTDSMPGNPTPFGSDITDIFTKTTVSGATTFNLLNNAPPLDDYSYFWDENIPEEYVLLAERAADAAGVVIRKYFRRRSIDGEVKEDMSPVTIADHEAEKVIREVIEEGMPGVRILGEEGDGIDGVRKWVGDELVGDGVGKDVEWCWIVDPIDGTKAFMTGRPTFGTLIALCRWGKPVVGVVDQVVAGERWVGVAGKGTTFNGKVVQVKESENDGDLKNSVVYATTPDMFVGLDRMAFRRLERKVARVLYGCDCYAYGLLASGFVDMVVEADLKPWDFMALVPVVLGAKGLITDWNGGPLSMRSDGRVVAAADSKAHTEAVVTLQSVDSAVAEMRRKRATGNGAAIDILPEDPGPGSIESMTGYGSSVVTGPDCTVSVQMQSVNNRYCDVSCRLPRILQKHESEFNSVVKQLVGRGKIIVSITIANNNSESNGARAPGTTESKLAVKVDRDAVREVASLLREVHQAADIQTPLSLADIMTFSEVFTRRDSDQNISGVLETVKKALYECIEDLRSMRRREGAILEIDLQQRCDQIMALISEIEQHVPDREGDERKRLQSVIHRNVDESDYNLQRLETELALWADKVDITEELVRLRAHVQLFSFHFIGTADDQPIGPKLSFLLTEMHRESSTIASKANNSAISHCAILILQEVERIRQQVQNVK